MENQHLPNKTLEDLLSSRGYNGGFGDAPIRKSRDFNFYGVTQSRTGSSDVTDAFKICTSSDGQVVIKYCDVLTPIKYDEKSKLEISASALHLTIEGTGLETILDYIIERRLMWIKEPQNNEEMFLSEDEDDTVVIHSVEIKTIH